MVATVRDSADPVIIHTSKARGAELTSSYKEEKAALPLALDWARSHCPTDRISICSDSQSLLKNLIRVAHMAPNLIVKGSRKRLKNRWAPPKRRLNRAMIPTATNHVGKSKRDKKAKPPSTLALLLSTCQLHILCVKRQWFTTVCTTWTGHEDSFAANRLVSIREFELCNSHFIIFACPSVLGGDH